MSKYRTPFAAIAIVGVFVAAIAFATTISTKANDIGDDLTNRDRIASIEDRLDRHRLTIIAIDRRIRILEAWMVASEGVER
jgi:hypothetical protein